MNLTAKNPMTNIIWIVFNRDSGLSHLSVPDPVDSDPLQNAIKFNVLKWEIYQLHFLQ